MSMYFINTDRLSGNMHIITLDCFMEPCEYYFYKHHIYIYIYIFFILFFFSHKTEPEGGFGAPPLVPQDISPIIPPGTILETKNHSFVCSKFLTFRLYLGVLFSDIIGTCVILN